MKKLRSFPKKSANPLEFLKVMFKRTLVPFACAILLSACGGTGQDDGTSSSFSQEFSGLAIDGYLARATVFLDTNNDGTRNAWEAFAFTDNEGYFSFNPNTNTDYCRSDAPASEAQYCLRTNSERTDVVIRIDGGYDVLTGEPFVGQLSRRIENPNESNSSGVVVSPVTSLVTNLDSQQSSQLLETIGLQEQDLDMDYLNVTGNNDVDASVFNAAVKIHKVVTILSDRLTDTYDDIGEERGTPNDASSFVYSSLAREILNNDLDLNQVSTNQGALVNVLDQAEEELKSVYERRELDLPADLGDENNSEGFNRVIDVVGQMVDVVDQLIDPMDTSIDITSATGQNRAIETLVIKAISEAGVDATIENAVEFFTNEENNNLVDSLVSVLSDDRADIASLSRNDFDGEDFDSVEEITDASQLAEDAMPFTQLGGLRLRVSDLDLGRAPDQLKDAEVEWYFNGEASDITGSFVACVKFIDDANIDGSLGEGNTRGELVDGFWSLLGGDGTNIESFSLLLTITFLGSTYQAIVKQAGTETINNVTYQLFRFDNGEDIDQWHSLEGVTENNSIPQTNQECEDRLPSRIGI